MSMRLDGCRTVAVMFVLAVTLATAAAQATVITARQAHDLATSGKVLLVDIRTPGEWWQTGLAAPAVPITMHAPGFVQKIDAATGGDKSTPIALICAVGGRSARMQRVLAGAGYGNVMNVADGMLGSRYGPGWIQSGLPVKPYSP